MDAAAIEAMRKQMIRFTDNINFIDKTIRRLIREEREARDDRGGIGNPAQPVEATYEEQMREGSDKLRHAIELMRSGLDPATSRKLIWLQSSGSLYSEQHRAEPFIPKEPVHRRDGRICWQCGTPAFRGCKHMTAGY